MVPPRAPSFEESRESRDVAAAGKARLRPNNPITRSDRRRRPPTTWLVGARGRLSGYGELRAAAEAGLGRPAGGARGLARRTDELGGLVRGDRAGARALC